MARSHRRDSFQRDAESQAKCSCTLVARHCPRHHAYYYPGVAKHRAEEGTEEAQRLLAKEFGATVVHPAPESLL